MLYSLAVLINISEIVLTDCVHPTPTSASELHEMAELGVSVRQDKYGKLNKSSLYFLPCGLVVLLSIYGVAPQRTMARSLSLLLCGYVPAVLGAWQARFFTRAGRNRLD